MIASMRRGTSGICDLNTDSVIAIWEFRQQVASLKKFKKRDSAL